MTDREARNRLVTVGLWIAVSLSALGVVYAEHKGRTLFIELQALKAQRDDLDSHWGKLQIEQSFWATHARIEGDARSRLGMRMPPPEDVVVIEP